MQNKVLIDALKEELRKCDMMVNLTGERLKDLYDKRNEEKTEYITGTDLEIKETKVLNTTYTTFATTFKQLLASYADAAPQETTIDKDPYMRGYTDGMKRKIEEGVMGKSAEGNMQHELAAALEDFIDEHEFLDGMKLAGAILDKCPHLFTITTSVAKDIRFLNELKSRMEKGDNDATQYEYAMQMVDDWLHELKSGEAGKQPISDSIFFEAIQEILTIHSKYVAREENTPASNYLANIAQEALNKAGKQPEQQPVDWTPLQYMEYVLHEYFKWEAYPKDVAESRAKEYASKFHSWLQNRQEGENDSE